MIKISQQEALIRWDSLPRILKEMVFSEQNANILWLICETQHLSERKIKTVADLTGLVILGFILPEELAKEFGLVLNLDIKIANIIGEEIDRKIFFKIRNELREIYNPIPTSLEENAIPLKTQTFVSETLTPEKIISIKGGALETRAKEEGPLIIHEEKPATSEPAIAKPMKTFSPFGFFRSKAGQEEKTAVKVRVETPEKKKEEIKRVVHYSEFRTPVAPLAGKEEFMSLDKFEKEAVAEAPITLIENAKPQEHSPEQIKPVLQAKTFFSWPHKTQKEEANNNRTIRQPKLDGNIIDLS